MGLSRQHGARQASHVDGNRFGSIRRQFGNTAKRNADFTHAVVGGGVVGLAIARKLQQHGHGVSTVLIEKHGAVGTETSSRNSEVSGNVLVAV